MKINGVEVEDPIIADAKAKEIFNNNLKTFSCAPEAQNLFKEIVRSAVEQSPIKFLDQKDPITFTFKDIMNILKYATEDFNVYAEKLIENKVFRTQYFYESLKDLLFLEPLTKRGYLRNDSKASKLLNIKNKELKQKFYQDNLEKFLKDLVEIVEKDYIKQKIKKSEDYTPSRDAVSAFKELLTKYLAMFFILPDGKTDIFPIQLKYDCRAIYDDITERNKQGGKKEQDKNDIINEDDIIYVIGYVLFFKFMQGTITDKLVEYFESRTTKKIPKVEDLPLYQCCKTILFRVLFDPSVLIYSQIKKSDLNSNEPIEAKLSPVQFDLGKLPDDWGSWNETSKKIVSGKIESAIRVIKQNILSIEIPKVISEPENSIDESVFQDEKKKPSFKDRLRASFDLKKKHNNNDLKNQADNPGIESLSIKYKDKKEKKQKHKTTPLLTMSESSTTSRRPSAEFFPRHSFNGTLSKVPLSDINNNNNNNNNEPSVLAFNYYCGVIAFPDLIKEIKKEFEKKVEKSSELIISYREKISVTVSKSEQLKVDSNVMMSGNEQNFLQQITNFLQQIATSCKELLNNFKSKVLLVAEDKESCKKQIQQLLMLVIDLIIKQSQIFRKNCRKEVNSNNDDRKHIFSPGFDFLLAAQTNIINFISELDVGYITGEEKTQYKKILYDISMYIYADGLNAVEDKIGEIENNLRRGKYKEITNQILVLRAKVSGMAIKEAAETNYTINLSFFTTYYFEQFKKTLQNPLVNQDANELLSEKQGLYYYYLQLACVIDPKRVTDLIAQQYSAMKYIKLGKNKNLATLICEETQKIFCSQYFSKEEQTQYNEMLSGISKCADLLNEIKLKIKEIENIDEIKNSELFNQINILRKKISEGAEIIKPNAKANYIDTLSSLCTSFFEQFKEMHIENHSVKRDAKELSFEKPYLYLQLACVIDPDSALELIKKQYPEMKDTKLEKNENLAGLVYEETRKIILSEYFTVEEKVKYKKKLETIFDDDISLNEDRSSTYASSTKKM